MGRDGERWSTSEILAPGAAFGGVLLLLVSMVLLVLRATGHLAGDSVSVFLTTALGIAGGALLLLYLRLDWRKDMRAPAPPPGGRLEARFRLGTPRIPGAVAHQGSVSIEGEDLVLEVRTIHSWLLWTCWALMQMHGFLRSGPRLLETTVVALSVIGSCIAMLLALRRRTLRIPLGTIRLAVASGEEIHLHHGEESHGCETRVLLSPAVARVLRGRLGERVPVEVLPPPARPRRTASSPLPRVPPPPPRTTLDARKVRELDRAMEDLQRLDRGPGPS